MSTNSEIQAQLKGKALFHEFSAEELDAFLDLLDQVQAKTGELIVKQDDPGDCMFIMVSGTARVVHFREEREIELATLRSGDFFGEIALVDRGPRSANVYAAEECVLLKVTQAVVSALAGVYPTAAFKFLIALGRILVERLRKSNQRYIDSLLFPVAGKD